MGSPQRVLLVEAGPGDGTLMSDMLRAARVAPGFLEAAEVWLVETSAPLCERQRERLGEMNWARDLPELPAGAPVILIANELLDCLPANQFIRTERGWGERMVGASDRGLEFGLRPITLSDDAPPGVVYERSPAQEAFGGATGELIAREGGAALLIDYGRAEPGFGDTLQALKRHEKVDPLACPGEADLTVHADFPAVLAAARTAGVETALLAQGAFLRRLGIEHRAAALAARSPDRADVIARQLDRLVGADQMGELFKAACIHSPGLVPPGFEEVS
jgi:SAM-dependent MidA family methyltransferase